MPRTTLRTSAETYEEFKRWVYIDGVTSTNTGKIAEQLYDKYADYSPLFVDKKQAVAGADLNAAMLSLLDKSGDNTIRIQLDPHWPTADKAALKGVYDGTNKAPSTAEAEMAEDASDAYLHIYPKPLRQKNNNWRIGINVVPSKIPDAVGALMPVMKSHSAINHIKFLAPGDAGKPDSVIVYMRKGSDYDTIKAAVKTAITTNGVTLQEVFSPMWNEILPGIAEASEPPLQGGSFGTYRCLIFTLVYRLLMSKITIDYSTFSSLVDEWMGHYGVPIANPHLQDAIDHKTKYTALNDVFQKARALHGGKEPTYYAHKKLKDR